MYGYKLSTRPQKPTIMCGKDSLDCMYNKTKMQKLWIKSRSDNKTISYGAGAKRIAGEAKVSTQEAQEFIDAWYAAYPAVRPWHEDIHQQVDADQRVYGLWGLKRRLPHTMSREDNLADLKRMAINCVDIETEILTFKGWQKYNEAKAGDGLLTFNMETGQLERDTLSLIRVFDKNDEEGIPCIEFAHPSISAVSTLDHRWPIFDDCVKSHTVYRFASTTEIKSNGSHKLLRCADNQFADNPDWTDTQLALIGWLVTDGYFGKGKVTICQSLSANPHKVARIQEILDILQLRYTRKDKVRYGRAQSFTTSTFYIHQCTFIATLRNDIIPDRKLPYSLVASLSQRQAKVLVDEMLLGCGSIKDRKHDMWRFTCGDYAKASVFQALCIQAGVATSASEITPIGVPQYSPLVQAAGVTAQKPYFNVNLLHRTRANLYTHHRRELFVDRVWCPTTRNGTWIARRNGTVYITGNCPVQNFASEFNMFLLIWIADEIKVRGIDWGVKLVNTVHDSIIYEVHPDCMEELANVYQWAMDAANDMCRDLFGAEAYIEMKGDMEVGEVWSDLKGVELVEDGSLVYKE